jgi:hypothetical protein
MDYAHYRDWVETQMNRVIADRMKIAALFGDEMHDHHVMGALPDATVQVVYRDPPPRGWSAPRERGPARFLPFVVKTDRVAFIWIKTVNLPGGGETVGFHARYAEEDPQTRVLNQCEHNFTLHAFCEATGYVPEQLRSDKAS